jgi:hypothetical protein
MSVDPDTMWNKRLQKAFEKIHDSLSIAKQYADYFDDLELHNMVLDTEKGLLEGMRRIRKYLTVDGEKESLIGYFNQYDDFTGKGPQSGREGKKWDF